MLRKGYVRLLRGKTIECISLIGLAVGKDVFLSDAEQIMNMLLKAQTDEGEEMEADDPQVIEIFLLKTRLHDELSFIYLRHQSSIFMAISITK